MAGASVTFDFKRSKSKRSTLLELTSLIIIETSITVMIMAANAIAPTVTPKAVISFILILEEDTLKPITCVIIIKY